MMMKVDDWWVFKRMEGDNDQWYYLDNQNQQWHKFSNDKNYADDLRETVVTTSLIALAIPAGNILPVGKFLRVVTAGSVSAISKRIRKSATSSVAKSVENSTMPISNISVAPKKLISSDMGRIIGWGEGKTAEAVQQTINVTKNLNKQQIQDWAKQGLTKDWVQKQLDAYSKALSKGGKKLDNINLLPRKQLMEKILELWD
jgi:predicted RNA-binding protein YlqC (UPF0109 family)